VKSARTTGGDVLFKRSSEDGYLKGEEKAGHCGEGGYVECCRKKDKKRALRMVVWWRYAKNLPKAPKYEYGG